MNEVFQSELDQYLSVLKANKAKITSQRIQILKVFLENKTEHFTAEEIIERLADTSTGQATVYRTLDLFCHLGILKKVNIPPHEEYTQYDLVDLNERFHHHLICIKCGKVMEIAGDLLNEVEAYVNEHYQFSVKDNELYLYGYCKDCRDDNENR
ncbi:MAG TPA: Fur family transcriptional regulator [Haloplasmataceae bacterium]